MKLQLLDYPGLSFEVNDATTIYDIENITKEHNLNKRINLKIPRDRIIKHRGIKKSLLEKIDYFLVNIDVKHTVYDVASGSNILFGYLDRRTTEYILSIAE